MMALMPQLKVMEEVLVRWGYMVTLLEEGAGLECLDVAGGVVMEITPVSMLGSGD